ncbi:hypothetical protein RyT2_12220 [Pseudolactococcus yaeyamensis]
MITLKNKDLIAVCQLLKQTELLLKVSRIRTKLVKLIQVKIEDFYKDELELVEKFGKRNETGELLETDGSFTLVTDTAQTYHHEKAILLDEEIQIDVAELKAKLPILIEAFENSDMTVSGDEAETLDLLMEKLEEEET